MIRPAEASDDDPIWAILEPVFRAGETYAQPRDISRADALAYWRAAPHRVFVAEGDGAVLGTSYVRANAQGGGDHVANAAFATSPTARGRGVARAMLAHALDFARAQGFTAMQFNYVLASNAPALALWLDAGFAEVGRVPGAFRHPSLGLTDALILHRAL